MVWRVKSTIFKCCFVHSISIRILAIDQRPYLSANGNIRIVNCASLTIRHRNNSYSSRDQVMRLLCLLAVTAALAIQVMAADGDRPQVTPPGIDTARPVVTMMALPCGVREYTATELRNVPNPPRPTPQERDQVEKGIQRIRLALDPSAVNVRLTLITGTTFPRDPAYYTFVYRVSLIDASKPGSCQVEVLDWAGNLTTHDVMIGAAAPAITSTDINLGTVRVGTNGQGTVGIVNNNEGPLVLTSISFTTGARFTITAGGNTPITIAPGATHTIAFSYTPTIASENGDNDVLRVETACGFVTANVRGTGGVSRIVVEDWDAGRQDLRTRVCKVGGLRIQNTGNIALQVSATSISDPAFTLTNTTPATPFTINAGAEVFLTELCVTPTAVQAYAATLTLTTDAVDAADNVANLTATGYIHTSVDDEIGQLARVWFDGTNENIVFTAVVPNTVVAIHDMHGRVLSSYNVGDSNTFRVGTSNWPTGVVMITYTGEQGARTRTLAISR